MRRKRESDRLGWVERFERNTTILSEYAEGNAITQIARKHQLLPQTVKEILVTAGVENPLYSPSAPQPNIARDRGIRAARARGESIASLAESYRISKQRISEIGKKSVCEHCGASIRSRSDMLWGAAE